jgi:hypothetical protein
VSIDDDLLTFWEYVRTLANTLDQLDKAVL